MISLLFRLRRLYFLCDHPNYFILVLHDYGSHISSAWIPQLIQSRGQVLPDLEQDVVRHHIAGRLIFESRYVVSPFQELLKHAVLCHWLKCTVSTNDHIIVVIFHDWFNISLQAQSITFMYNLAQELKRVLRIRSQTFFNKFYDQYVIDIKQVMGVFSCIPEHLICQRPLPPICQLVFLVSNHVAIGLKQMSQGETL